MTGRPLAAYSPEALESAALDELCFGAGTFSIGLESHQRAMKMNIPWQVWLIRNNFEKVFETQVRGNRLVLYRLPIFESLVRGLGYSMLQLEMTTEERGRKAFLNQFKELLS